ncbi:hypothetical protein AMAG_07708 [Allomyces macrogynus ATCC 38327]|uniref:Tr-type G domain-containing protein n=1 Tax=Allomyces macrogynus (strain ATCC 38327) TaxID=578462 RepID=A0A0L0SJ90_ALLM3|nr:hypothetical protein AMAG_07708 [Allomyces macrogynus ATCC 38327]|eukprot:KNE62494.1 hypothetical protein AMAG_07708 [Allomyces macrogynus ATCC 38327]
MFQQTSSPQRISRAGFLAQFCADEALPPEVEEGNVEYKLKLVNISDERFVHLVTQMKWRLAEGCGEALYEIGIADNGQLVGLSSADLAESLRTLEAMAAHLDADCSIVRQRQVLPRLLHGNADTDAEPRHVAEILVRKRVDNEDHFLEIRVAILGGSDAGKSTLLGVLTHSELDNGLGRARSRAFNHKHELESGRTSSLASDLVGFASDGRVVNYATTSVHTAQDIVEQSSKIVTLTDTCGLAKFLPTTIAGITARQPHFAMLMVNAAHWTEMTREHLGMLLVLRIPFFVVVTKVDCTPPDAIRNTLASLIAVLKGPGGRALPYICKNEDDIVAVLPHLAAPPATSHSPSLGAPTRGTGGVVPIFLVSSVTGDNIPLLTKFLNLLPQPPAADLAELAVAETEFQVQDVYDVPSVGTVVGGHVLAGSIATARAPRRPQPLFLGPFADGTFRRVVALSIHRFCRAVHYVRANQAATVALAYWPETGEDESTAVETSTQTLAPVPPTDLRRGMVLVGSRAQATAAWTIDVELHLLYHASALTRDQTTVIYCGSVRAAAKVDWIDGDGLRTGDRSTVRFRFVNHPEWVRPGMTLLAREGRAGKMKCVGTVLRVGGEVEIGEPAPSPLMSPAGLSVTRRARRASQSPPAGGGGGEPGQRRRKRSNASSPLAARAPPSPSPSPSPSPAES